MAATPATAFFANMAVITGNAGGPIEQLLGANVVHGRRRSFMDSLTLASQPSGTIFGVARIPLYASLLGITLITDTSLGAATIEFGDAGNGNAALFAGALTLTSLDTPTRIGKASALGVPITEGYDCVTGVLLSPFTPQAGGAQGGFCYEDIIMTTGTAALPSSGTLKAIVDYMID